MLNWIFCSENSVLKIRVFIAVGDNKTPSFQLLFIAQNHYWEWRIKQRKRLFWIISQTVVKTNESQKQWTKNDFLAMFSVFHTILQFISQYIPWFSSIFWADVSLDAVMDWFWNIWNKLFPIFLLWITKQKIQYRRNGIKGRK